jgi:hypothetical protein
MALPVEIQRGPFALDELTPTYTRPTSNRLTRKIARLLSGDENSIELDLRCRVPDAPTFPARTSKPEAICSVIASG